MSSSKTPSKIGGTTLAFLDVIKQATSLKFTSIFSTRSSARVDNYIFKLHSTVTVVILSISIVFVGMKQYFGEPIECLNAGSPSLTQAQMQHFCWMEGAFTIIGRYPGHPEITGLDMAYPGVKHYAPHKGDLKMSHKYYQWVYYVLCIQCILFYIPKHIWRLNEDDRLKTLISYLRSNHIASVDDLLQYQLVQDTFDTILISNDYFYSILFCEIISLIHLVLQIWFTDLFLSGNFLYLGFQWLYYSHHSPDIHYDPLIKVFPRLTKCSFHRFGMSGSIETVDTLCFMSLNIVNEKVFVILWFWFLFLLLVTTFHLLFYRVAVILLPFFRLNRIKAIAPTANEKFIRKLVKKPGTWFVLHTIASNLKPYYFRDLLERVLEDHFDEKTMKHESKVTLKDLIIQGKVPVATALTIPTEKKKEKEKDSSKKKKKDKDKDKDKNAFNDSVVKEETTDWPTADTSNENTESQTANGWGDWEPNTKDANKTGWD